MVQVRGHIPEAVQGPPPSDEEVEAAFTPEILKIYRRRSHQYGYQTERVSNMAMNGILMELTDRQAKLEAAREEASAILRRVGEEMNRQFPQEMARYRELEQAIKELDSRVEGMNNLALRFHQEAERRKEARRLLRAVPGLSREPKSPRLRAKQARRRQELAAMIERGEIPAIFSTKE